jgi:hypothetical protein
MVKPNIDLMRCEWDVKWFTFMKEMNGVKDRSKGLGIDKELRVCGVAFNAQKLYCYTRLWSQLWRITKPNIYLMRCGWDVKWLAFTKERHGANDPTKRLGFDKEMKVCRVAFNAQ